MSIQTTERKAAMDFVYVGSPRDLVQALMDRAWADDCGDLDRLFIETASKALSAALDRCETLGVALEKREAGL
jgi:hypothetical protein